MFGIKELFWIKDDKQKIELSGDNIKAFNTAIYAIKDFIDFKDWDKAAKWIKEIRDKEQKNLDFKLMKVEHDSKEAKEEIAKVTERFKTLERLKNKLDKERRKYEKSIEDKRYKARLEMVEEKFRIYINRWEFDKCFSLLSDFLNDFHNDDRVVAYVTKRKKETVKKQAKWSKITKSIVEETRDLVWESAELWDLEEEGFIEKESLKDRIKAYFNTLSERKRKIQEKELLDEVNIMIQERWDEIDENTKEKLTNIHKGLSKEIKWVDMIWYDFYWKIMWADKISWDTFWMKENKDFYRFFLWDATGHWIKAGLMISILSNKFEEIWWMLGFRETAMELNNSLKQELKSWNFVTSIFYQINKDDHKKIKFIWMWHEPMFVYRADTHKIEKVIPWWIAAWIRVAKNADVLKEKELILSHWDIAIAYSDWIAEAKSPDGEYYWFERLKESFKLACQKHKVPDKIYKQLIEDVKNFHAGTKFDDDLSIILIRRNEEKDIINDDDTVKEIMEEFWVWEEEARKYKWKSKDKIKELVESEKREKELKAITRNLKEIYMTWDFLKLKQESIRYIKEWYIHKEINFYLKKANDNEFNQKIKIKNERLANKYNILKWLYEKWDYELVIKECEEIISKDWNI